MGGETWVEKPEFLAPVSDTSTETTCLAEVVSGIVELVKIGVERGIMVCCDEETGGGQDVIMIGVVVFLGEG